MSYFVVFRTSLIITFVGEGTSIFSGFVVFTVLGFMAHELNVPVEDVVKSGTRACPITAHACTHIEKINRFLA